MLRHGFIASLLLIGLFVLLTTLTSFKTMAEGLLSLRTSGRYLSPAASPVTFKAARCMRSCRSINQKQLLSWGQSCSRASRTRTNDASSGSSYRDSLRPLTASKRGATSTEIGARSHRSPACSCVSITLPEQTEPPGLFLILVVVGLDALDDDVIGAFFIDRPLAAVGVIA